MKVRLLSVCCVCDACLLCVIVCICACTARKVCALQSALQSDTAKSREGWYAKGGRPPAYTYLVRDLHLDGVDAGDVDVCRHFFAHLKAQVSQDQLDVTLSQGSDLHDHKAGRRH